MILELVKLTFLRIISLGNKKLIRLTALFAIFLIPVFGFSTMKNDSLKLRISKEIEYKTGVATKQNNQYSKTLLKDWTKAPNSYVFDPNSSYGESTFREKSICNLAD
jgi:hypothetical protein